MNGIKRLVLDKFERLKFYLFKDNTWIFVLIFLAGLIFRLLYYFKLPELWWDEAVYIGMGKYIFSGGVLGIWEVFRPIIMPILLGFGWFLGIPIFLWGNFIQLVLTMGIVLLVYLIGEKLCKNTGIIASALVVFMPVFLSFGDKNLSAIPATLFFLIAIWFVIKQRWYLSGLFMSLAFLTRYVMGLVTVAVGFGLIVSFLTEKKWDKKSIYIFLKKAYLMLFGFLTLVLPYLILNKIMYADFFSPMKEGSRIFTDFNNWLYDLGNTFYLEQLFTQNFLLILFVVGIVLYIILKKYKDSGFNSVVFMSFLLSAYFLKVVHKEVRFVIPVFVLFSILSGFFIAWIVNLVRINSIDKRRDWLKYLYFVFILLITILIAFSVYKAIASDTPYFLFEESFSGPKKDFYTYFENQDKDNLPFMTSSPFFAVFTDKQSILLRDWYDASYIYKDNVNKVDAIAVDLCEHPCDPATNCEEVRYKFLSMLNETYEIEFNTSYIRWDGKHCDLIIWEVR